MPEVPPGHRSDRQLLFGAAVAFAAAIVVAAAGADSPSLEGSAQVSVADGALQAVPIIPHMPLTAGSFDGLSSQDNQDAYGVRPTPPNTGGEVGPNHYVQVVSALVRIFNKDGTPANGKPLPFKMSTVFASATLVNPPPSGSLCATHDDGDARVLYDQLADRWLLMQIAFTSPTSLPYHQCIAVSQTPDPAGAYFAYDFALPAAYRYRNAALGVWPDGYYMAANQVTSAGAPAGVGVFAFDRAHIHTGAASSNPIYFDLGTAFSIGTSARDMLPADLDGSTAPPPGTPNYFAMRGDTLNFFGTGGATSTLRLFAFHADFATPMASTFVERPESPLSVAAYDARSPNFTQTIEQPAAPAGAYLDAAQGRLMQRLAYRSFGGARESLVVTHTVNVGRDPTTAAGHQAAVRYYELRRNLPSGTFGAAEQASFAPDSDNRWMASAAMDKDGNLAVGYSVSSLTTYPSIRYAGRLASDPQNGLYQGEVELVAGSGVQLDPGGWWGGLSSLTVDPADDCTFWYTNQYYTSASQASSTVGWLTRIGSFKFPSCSGQAGTISGYVRDAATSAPVPNAVVTVNPGGTSSFTDVNGLYMRSLSPGTYTVTASASAYSTAVASGIDVIGGGPPATRDFELTFTGGTLTGHVTSAATNGPVANAWVSIEPGGLGAATDAAGLWTTRVPPGTYTLTPEATDFLPVSGVAGVTATSNGTTTQDFSLTPVTFTQAVFSSTLKAPACGAGSSGCDSGTLLIGRDTMAGGAEPNQPNTIFGACPDSTAGTFHVDESNDRLRVSTIDGGVLAAGKVVRVSATTWARYSGGLDKLDLFYASNAGLANWTYFATLTPPATGLQTLSATYVLPSGSDLQAVRARFRFQGSVASCSGSSAGFSDQDDLVFGVALAPTVTTQPSSQTVAAGRSAMFSVVANATPTYQWQMSANGGASWTNLGNVLPYSGATTSTLLVANVTTTLDGSAYRAVASNSIGSVASSAAVLTVTTPTLALTPGGQDFGPVVVGGAADRTFTIQNTGTGTLSGTASIAAGTGGGPTAFGARGAVAQEIDDGKHVAGRLLVRFRDGVANTQKTTAHALVGSTRLRTFGGVPNLELVRLPAGRSVKQAMDEYRRRPDVLYAEPDYIVHPTTAPNDSQFGAMWSLQNTGQLGGTIGADIHATQAWNLTTGSSSVVVVVIDTGIDYSHPDLAANMFRNTPDCNNNGIDDDGNGFVDDCFGIDTFNNDSDPMDDVDHGTHVAGTIGAVGNNTIGVVGVNWNVRLMACKFLGANGGSTSGAIACLDYVKTMKDRGVNIVATNNSWGGGGFSQALYDAVDAQRQRGVLFVASAGNASLDADATPQYPGGFTLPNVIAVAATTRFDNKASFSNVGRHTVHLGAPGAEILSTTPGNTYNTFSGTSMAAPHVTGVAALLKAQEPTRDWRAIKNLILAGGDATASMAETITGRRLNAFGALTCSGSTVLGRLQPVQSVVFASAGVPLTLSVLHINCASPNGDVVVTVNPGASTVTLVDSGAGVDVAAGDGIYSVQWAPPSTGGNYALTFPGGDVVTVVTSADYGVQAAAFNYRTIGGTPLNVGDDSAASITSPFPILFGANTSVTNLFAGSNGVISLDTGFASGLNTPLPASGVSSLIAPFWDDLEPRPSTTGQVFWAVTGSTPNRELVVEWRNVEKLGCTGSGLQFEVVFFEGSSNILFNYAQTTVGGSCPSADHGGSATIGVQAAADRAKLFSFNQASVSDGTALLWTVAAAGPFSIVSGGAFDLAPGGTQVLTVRLRPTAVGSAEATLEVGSNGGSTSAALTGMGMEVPPTIIAQPANQAVAAGDSASFTVGVNVGVAYQWQISSDGGTSWTNVNEVAPYAGVHAATLGISSAAPGLSGTRYRAVVTNGAGSATSNAATLSVYVLATYDSALKAPTCGSPTGLCDSGALLLGRDSMFGGPEPHQPNTILNSCPDGAFGAFHEDESIDHLRVSTADGSLFAPGKTLMIEATVWVYGPAFDLLDLYYSSNPTSSSPTWTYITTLTAPPTPSVSGKHMLSTTYTVLSGGLQAVRARLRYQGSPSPCTGGTDHFDDHDDLVFAASAAPAAPVFSAQATNQTVIAGSTATFVAAASGEPTPSYQWQLSTDGGSLWTNLANAAPYSGVTTTTLTVSGAVFALNGYQFRAVATNVSASAASGGATLTVINPLTVTTLAGLAGTSGSTDGTGSNARFGQPWGMAVDRDGNVYVTDSNTIRKITPAGVVSTLAGAYFVSGTADGTGSAARFNGATGLAIDSAGVLYVADSGNNAIRKVTPGGVVTTLAGLKGSQNVGGTDGVGTSARFYDPRGIAVDANGIVYVADTFNCTIRKITPAGVVTTLAGVAIEQGTEDGTGATARFSYPFGVAVDVAGTIYVADTGTNTFPISKIRQITPAGVVTTLAGSAIGSADGPGSTARFMHPHYLAVAGGVIYVGDRWSHTIRQITSDGSVVTVAGLANVFGSADGTGSAARLFYPEGLAVDNAGHLYIADTFNATIRRASGPSGGPVFATQPTSQFVNAGSDATFTVAVNGTPAPTLQWQVSMSDGAPFTNLMNTAPYSGVTNATLTVAGVPPELAGSRYRAVASNSIDFATSDAAALVLATPPVFTTEPVDQAVGFGQTASFAVATSGTPSASYQWQVSADGSSFGNLTNTAPYSGVTTATLTISGVTGALSGYRYRTVATNIAGAATSGSGILTVDINMPGFVTHPVDQTVEVGQTATFAVVAGGNPTPNLQWQVSTDDGLSWTSVSNTPPYGGATTATLKVTSSTVSVSQYRFRVVATNNLGSATSNTATLTVNGLTMSTFAGLAGALGGQDGTGAGARFQYPGGVAVDSAGTVYVASTGNNTIRKITPNGVVTTLAGSPSAVGGMGSTDGTGSAARFSGPSSIAVDVMGNLYVTDQSNYTIRKVTPAGVVTTLAGLAGAFGSADGTGSSARFWGPHGIAVDAGGNVYVADMYNHTIRRITSAGVVTTFAGSPGNRGYADGTGSAAQFSTPTGVAIDGAGNVLVSEADNRKIRRITPAGVVTTVASVGPQQPMALAVDPAGSVYVLEYDHAIRKVTAGGLVLTVAGSPAVWGEQDGPGGVARFLYPAGIAVDSAGIVYIADTANSTIRKGVTSGGPFITTQPANQLVVAGQDTTFSVGVGGTPTPTVQWQVSVDGGASWVNLTNTGPYSGVTTTTLTITGTTTDLGGYQYSAVATNGAGVATSNAATLTLATPPSVRGSPIDQTVGPGANAFFGIDAIGPPAPSYSWQVSTDGGASWTNLADTPPYGGVTTDQLRIVGVSIAWSGYRYRAIATNMAGSTASNSAMLTVNVDFPGFSTNATDQTIDPGQTAIFTVVATGNPTPSLQWQVSLDGKNFGNLAAAPPYGGVTTATLTVSNATLMLNGFVYRAMATNSLGSAASPSATLHVNGLTVATLAGTPGVTGSVDGTGSSAHFSDPRGLAVDTAGNVYVADRFNRTIRKIAPGAVVTTLAGLAGAPMGTVDGTGSAARFASPWGLAVDSGGNVYVADQYDHVIRKISPAGVVTTLAGTPGSSGSADGSGSAARFYAPFGVAVDGAGTVYVADTSNNTIRKITPAGVVSTFAGLAGNPGSADGTGTAARFFGPGALAVDNAGNVYVSGNNTVRKITPAGVVTTLAGSPGNAGTSDGTGSSARFSNPSAVAVDSAGTVYVVEEGFHTIRKVSAAGVVTTIAGASGIPGTSDGAGFSARFRYPSGLATDSAGAVYISDTGNSTIRKATP